MVVEMVAPMHLRDVYRLTRAAQSEGLVAWPMLTSERPVPIISSMNGVTLRRPRRYQGPLSNNSKRVLN